MSWLISIMSGRVHNMVLLFCWYTFPINCRGFCFLCGHTVGQHQEIPIFPNLLETDSAYAVQLGLHSVDFPSKVRKSLILCYRFSGEIFLLHNRDIRAVLEKQQVVVVGGFVVVIFSSSLVRFVCYPMHIDLIWLYIIEYYVVKCLARQLPVI
jgi:hypothetical protein